MKSFTSQADLQPEKIFFRRLSANAWAFTTEGDPNSGIIAGEDDASRAYDEARGIRHLRIWTAKRDRDMWSAIAS